MKPVLIIGGTGNVGRQVALQLLAEGTPVRVMTRKSRAVNLPPEVEMGQGDLTDPSTLKPHLRDVEKVFLTWATLPTNVAASVKALTSVQRIVFLSNMTVSDEVESYSNHVSTLHAEIERLISASGIEWSFLRPGPFATNSGIWWAPQIRSGNIVRWPYGAAASSLIHEYDIAAVAVRALCEDHHVGAKYVLTGPESLTHVEQVETIGNAIGRPLRYEEITPDDARAGVMASWPPSFADMLLNAWPNLVGKPMIVTSTVKDVAGTAPRSFHTWAVEHAAEFQSTL